MSEDATGAAGTDAGTAEDPNASDATETGAEDAEAAGLLGGMLGNDPEALAAELAKWKDQARKWEGRAKTNSDAAARLTEIEQANMSELEKAQAAQRTAEEERDNAVSMHNRVMAAAAHNLPVELIDYLGSGTEDEVMERAEAIAAVIGRQAQALADQILAGNRNGMPFTGARPVESMRAGSAPAQGGTPQTPDDWFRQLLSDRLPER